MQHEYFVYDGQEVMRTGRIASRENVVRGYKGSKTVNETVIEITPVVQPGEYAWKRWVQEGELFVINESLDSDGDPDLPVDVPADPKYDPVDQILDTLRDRNNNGETR